MYKFNFNIFITLWKVFKERQSKDITAPKKSVDGFEINKIMASILIALLAAKVFDVIGDNVVKPEKRLLKNSYLITVTESTSTQVKAEKELAPITPLLEKANVENGEKAFKKCMQCHVIEKDKPHGIGPNLFGVVGRAIASLGDYAYSSAMKEKAAIIWDVEKINHFIYNPRKFVKGTKMTFLGIESDQERADIIAYLKKKSD